MTNSSILKSTERTSQQPRINLNQFSSFVSPVSVRSKVPDPLRVWSYIIGTLSAASYITGLCLSISVLIYCLFRPPSTSCNRLFMPCLLGPNFIHFFLRVNESLIFKHLYRYKFPSGRHFCSTWRGEKARGELATRSTMSRLRK